MGGGGGFHFWQTLLRESESVRGRDERKPARRKETTTATAAGPGLQLGRSDLEPAFHLLHKDFRPISPQQTRNC